MTADFAFLQLLSILGGSRSSGYGPRLAMGGGCGFKSRKVDCVDYITLLVVKIVLFVGKGAKINEKETGVGPLKNIKTKSLLRVTKELTFD